jgi:hypothetical protein
MRYPSLEQLSHFQKNQYSLKWLQMFKFNLLNFCHIQRSKVQNLNGSWKNPGGVIWKIKQTDDVVYITGNTGGLEYILSGFRRSGNTYHCIGICYKDGGVFTKYYDKLKVSDNKIEVEWECLETCESVKKGQTGKETWTNAD